MSTIQQFFTADHRACDDLWTKVEAAADAGDAPTTQARLTAFVDALRHHLAMEEDVLFPAIEDATGMRGVGPTQVMRMEHQQMRAVMGQMESAMSQGDLQGVLDNGDTLLMLIQQHNVKEEGILYPMADRALEAGSVLPRAQSLAAAGQER